jgi:HSP20 family protein
MAESINRYFHFLTSTKGTRPSDKLWYPAADVYRSPEGWVVIIELAGVSPEDIEIDIQGNTLYIAGCRRDKTCSKGVSYHQMEITYSRFEKTLRFPASIDGARIEHNFDNGLLIIRLRKGENIETAETETEESKKEQREI